MSGSIPGSSDQLDSRLQFGLENEYRLTKLGFKTGPYVYFDLYRRRERGLQTIVYDGATKYV